MTESSARDAAWMASVLQAVRETRYGSVEVVIHGGRVVQIERREKVRFAEDRAHRSSGGFANDEETRR